MKSDSKLLEKELSDRIYIFEKSEYEIGYLVNFGISYVQIVRRIYTNDRKDLRTIYGSRIILSVIIQNT